MTPASIREAGRKHGGRPDTNARARARTALVATCLVMGLGLVPGTSAQQSSIAGLAYDAQTRSVVPIPASERALQTAVAETWFKVSSE